jgi:hypothetical protein
MHALFHLIEKCIFKYGFYLMSWQTWEELHLGQSMTFDELLESKKFKAVKLNNGHCELPTHAMGDGMGFGSQHFR